MRGKEFFKSILSSFFIIVTLVNIATFILGSIFQPDVRFGYDAFLSPLIYGVFSLIPYIILYSKKELTMKQMLVRKILQLVCIEIIILSIIFGSDLLIPENLPLIAPISLSIFIIFLLVMLIQWLMDLQAAKRMTEELMHYQETRTDSSSN